MLLLILTFEVRKEGGFRVVIYADVLFGINFIMDLIVLLIFNRIGKQSARFSRIVLAALTGALWSVIEICIPMHLKGVSLLITYAVIPYVMVAIISGTLFSKKIFRIKKIIKKMLLLFAIAFLLSGAVNCVYCFTNVGLYINQFIFKDAELLMFIIISIFLIIIIAKVISEEKTYKDKLRILELCIFGKNVSVTVLADTGNTLTDIHGGKPVTIIEKNCIMDILEGIIIDDLLKINYHYIPFHTIGIENAVIEVVTADYIRIYEKTEEKRLIGEWKDMPLGLSKMRISTNGEYFGLLGGYLCEK